ncbi:unannotated protein [freshwater metagenome]|uniref:Unannotated protein n=1 Tax=freshwater metagenome TaxID=449393 RepID=A0A6J6Z2M6_9ZZZZ
MCSADTRARQHRDGGLGDHRHIDVDAVTLDDSEALEHICEPLCLVEQLRIGHRAGVAWFALEMERNLVAFTGQHMTVEAVVAHVQFAADEPLRERKIPLRGGVPILRPRNQFAGLLRPKGCEVLRRFFVQRVIRDESVAPKRIGGNEGAALPAK